MKNSKTCFNCESPLGKKSKYCKFCGQKVDDNDLTLKSLGNDFVENYLSLDTRFGRSIIPFLFKPGYLAQKFINGKRLSYANPFKFYLIVSIFFFFTIGLLVNRNNENSSETFTEIKDDKGEVVQLEDLNELAGIIDSIENSSDSVNIQQQVDSLLKAQELEGVFKVTQDSVASNKKKFVSVSDNGYGVNINTSQLQLINKYRYNANYSSEQLLDSIQTRDLGDISKYFALQTIKLYRSDYKVITRFFLGNFSFALLTLIPLLALIFGLFFRKNKMGFVKHLIHSLHIHTFCLFIYSLALLLYYYTDLKFLIILAFLLSIIYWYFSIKKIYKRTVFTSITRLVYSGILYYLVWGFILACGAIISFLLF